ncbi:MAG TPA: hypothetical protein VFH75_07165, partial [Actinomycetota bacterium]|nr:hypothetical protein [Actinomycetota bacterium]
MEVVESRGQRFTAWIRDGLQVPLSAATLLVGSASIALAILGPLAVVAAHGFTPYEAIVTAFQSDATAVVLLTGIAMGIAAIGVGFSIYKRMPTKRAREQALAGAILGIQAVVLAAVFLWLRAGNPDRFTFHFLNFEKLEGFGGAFVRGAKNTVTLAFAGEA